MKAILSANVYAILNPKGSIWDAAINNSPFRPSPLPNNVWSATDYIQSLLTTVHLNTDITVNRYQADEISSTGSAIIASEMHLGIRVSNTWLRASFST
jgi:penicillin amidase